MIYLNLELKLKEVFWMKKIGFDNNKYLSMQSEQIRKRIADFIAEDEAHIVSQKAKLEDVNISLNEKEKISKATWRTACGRSSGWRI